MERVTSLLNRKLVLTGGQVLTGVACCGVTAVLAWRTGLLDVMMGEIGEWLRRAVLRRRHRRRPQYIILVRHGQSEGNVDSSVYRHTPDHKVKLTAKGKRQALAAGKIIKRLLGSTEILFYTSPHVRAKETLCNILQAFPDPSLYKVRVDPRIREQEFGNYQNVLQMREVLKVRRSFGRFFWRFQNGESGADVFDRVSHFWDTLYRQIDYRRPHKAVVIVSHGLTMRLFMMRYLHWSIPYFETVVNPKNTEVWVLEKTPKGDYSLITPIQTVARSSTASFGDFPGHNSNVTPGRVLPPPEKPINFDDPEVMLAENSSDGEDDSDDEGDEGEEEEDSEDDE